MFIGALFLFAATTCLPKVGTCETPISADSIADSIGVNIHLHNADTVYGNFPLIRALLADLGVRHTRDGLIDTSWKDYYVRHSSLAKLGIKCLFITSPAQSNALLSTWPTRVPGAFEGYEAPNEYDRSGDPGWAATLKEFIPRLHTIAKSNPATAQFAIVGPSLTQTGSYAQVAGLQQYFDFSNLHNYFGGRNPGTNGWGAGGYGSIVSNLDDAKRAWPGKPILTTETGYATDIGTDQGIPESVEGKYVPRVILEQALHGISRTYIYELIDDTSGAFGLARVDGSPKPAYSALRNLIATLTDPGPRFVLQNLQFQLLNAPVGLHHLLSQKRDGAYYLAFWQEEQTYDVIHRAETAVTPDVFTLVLTKGFKTMELITLAADGTIRKTTVQPAKRVELPAGDTVTLLRLK